MKRRTAAGLTLLYCTLMASCASEQFTNAPPAIVDECRREIALLTRRDPTLTDDSMQGTSAESTRSPIEAAKAAKAESEQRGLAQWPDDVRMYYCLQSSGVALTPEQARSLAEWKKREPPTPGK